ncbi:MAG: hypothetical protein LBV40_02890, partial [Methanomicrobiales archaeon]|nr:hypothetical protein [Methanomicrobiales archaeon]
YTQDNPLTIEGYTAEEISKLDPFVDMDGIDIYKVMVVLREAPNYVKHIIANGFQESDVMVG